MALDDVGEEPGEVGLLQQKVHTLRGRRNQIVHQAQEMRRVP
ncbi:hypothetical protein AHiyo4_03550 [Arthrobacter sp. Hiyo4]|nr:hypothetical protein AHiyo4_03550 [Arthrobacter sp. Hiyo4]